MAFYEFMHKNSLLGPLCTGGAANPDFFTSTWDSAPRSGGRWVGRSSSRPAGQGRVQAPPEVVAPGDVKTCSLMVL